RHCRLPARCSPLHFLSCLTTTPPPTPTPFPYTTLFRSCGDPSRAPVCAPDRWGRVRLKRPMIANRLARLLDTLYYAAAAGRDSLDRKSTRLNSSHEWISYAVFCLKKKRSQQERRKRDRA